MRILASATVALRRIIDIGLLVLILVVLFGITLAKGAPLVGRQSIVIGGESMEPAVGIGAAIIIRPVAAADLAVGDIVSMQVGEARTMFTHRIVDVVDRADGRWIRTKGDSNVSPDPTLVPASDVVGRVEFVIPLAGYLIALLSLPMGAMFVIGLAATMLAMAWLLESLELEQRPARRGADGGALDLLQNVSGTRPAPARPVVDPELLSGEPIAARSVAAPMAPTLGGTSASSAPPGGSPGRGLAPRRTFPASQFAPIVAVSGTEPGSVGRPTVRVQLERRREVRRRRARWLLGRGPGRRAAE